MSAEDFTSLLKRVANGNTLDAEQSARAFAAVHDASDMLCYVARPDLIHEPFHFNKINVVSAFIDSAHPLFCPYVVGRKSFHPIGFVR